MSTNTAEVVTVYHVTSSGSALGVRIAENVPTRDEADAIAEATSTADAHKHEIVRVWSNIAECVCVYRNGRRYHGM